MEYELWLFAVKRLAQTQEVCQIIYDQLPQEEKDQLYSEYRRTVLKENDKKSTENQVLESLRNELEVLHSALEPVKAYAESLDIRKKLAGLQNDRTSREQVFYMRFLLSAEQLLERLDFFISNLSKPVKAEGELTADRMGRFRVGDHVLKEGMLVEFMYQNYWAVGTFYRNPMLLNDYYFSGLHNEVYRVNLLGLHVRLR